MGSSGKTRTTYAKLNRESKLREKRLEKEVRKAARKLYAAGETVDSDHPPEERGSGSLGPDPGTADGTHAGPPKGDSGI